MLQKLKDTSLKIKFSVFITIVLIVFALISGFIAVNLGKNTLHEKILTGLDNTAKLKKNDIQQFFKNVDEDLKVIRQFCHSNEKAISTIQNNKYSDSVRKAAYSKIDNTLQSFKKVNQYSTIKIISSNNSLIYCTTGYFINKDRTYDKRFTQEKTKNISYSKIFKENDVYKKAATIPVNKKGDNYNIVLEIDMAPVYNTIQNTTGLGKTGETLIARKTDYGALFLNPLRHDPQAALNRKAKFGNTNAKPILEAVMGNASHGISTDYRSKEVIAVWKHIPSLNWGLVAKRDTNEVFAPVYKLRNTIIFTSLGILVLAALLSFMYGNNRIVKPLQLLKHNMQVLSQGNMIENKITKTSDDEIGQMTDATNALADYQKQITIFAEEVGAGNFDVDTDVTNKGKLGESLANMRNNLKNAAEKEEKSKWTTEGLAKFADILRSNNDDLEKLGDDIVANLAKYLQANQCTLFIVNEGDEIKQDEDFIKNKEGENEGEENETRLEMMACYAWDRKKYMQRSFQKGEGLAGRCWLEGQTIYLTEVPDNYVTITSGLGQANPTCILIVPLKLDDQVFGILELASFKEFMDYEIEFVEKLGESIASTVSSAKTNARTKRLLQESQEQSEQLRAQEEEVRQNMEELQATQEEMERVTKEKDKEIEELKRKLNEGKDSEENNNAE